MMCAFRGASQQTLWLGKTHQHTAAFVTNVANIRIAALVSVRCAVQKHRLALESLVQPTTGKQCLGIATYACASLQSVRWQLNSSPRRCKSACARSTARRCRPRATPARTCCTACGRRTAAPRTRRWKRRCASPQRATRAVALPRRARGLVSSRAGRIGMRPTDRATAFRLEALRELQPEIAARGSVLLVTSSATAAARRPRSPSPRGPGSSSSTIILASSRICRSRTRCGARARRPGSATAPAPCRLGRCRRRRSWAATRGSCARDARRARRARLAATPLAPARASLPPPPPPAWHLDLSGEAAVDEVLAAPSRRDTSVGRVARTRGGPRAAVARWEAWVANDGLAGYAKRGNDPLDVLRLQSHGPSVRQLRHDRPAPDGARARVSENS